MNNIKRVAIIDVGTLKSKFEVREYRKDESYDCIYKDKQLTVLGRELTNGKGIIDQSSIDKTIKALREFDNKMLELKVDSYKAVTTEAIRKASNGLEVVDAIKAATGIQLKVLTHEDEAQIFFHHISKSFPDKKVAVADVGGGSVQVVVGMNNTIESSHLFKTGTYFMQEEFSDSHHPTARELQNAKAYIQKELASLKKIYGVTELIYGSTNIVDFMKAMNIKLEDSGYRAPHQYRAQLKDLRETYDFIIKLSYEDRMPLYPAEPYYMWAADKALMNVFEMCRLFNLQSVIPTNENISGGLFEQLL